MSVLGGEPQPWELAGEAGSQVSLQTNESDLAFQKGSL